MPTFSNLPGIRFECRVISNIPGDSPVFRKKLLAIFLVCLLTGCSNTFIYNQLDWVIPWYVGDYLALNRTQKQAFKLELLPLLEWHRQEELQTYRVILDSIESDLDKPVTAAVVEGWADELIAAYDRLKQRGLPLAFHVGEQMSDLQLEYFIEEMYQRQDALEQEYLTRSEAEFRAQTYDNFEEGISGFIGRLEQSQLDHLQQAAADIVRFDKAWLNQRRAWLQRAEVLLERKPGWQQAIRDLLDNREQFESPAYKAANLHNMQLIYSALADVIEARTEKQDKRIRREIAGFRRDINTLIEQGQE
jgi:hypothetical protein